MAQFKTSRKFRHEFVLRWKEGNKTNEEDCWAVFNMLPTNEIEEKFATALKLAKNKTANQALLSVLVDDFGGLEMVDSKGKELAAEHRLAAAILDPVISSTLLVEWNQGRAGIGSEGNSSPKT
jgi:hypothetical protein